MVKGKKITDEVKLGILQNILERKDVLFGKFSSLLDNTRKKNSWEEVTEYVKSVEACESTRDWKFVRDKIYGQWKANTLVCDSYTYLFVTKDKLNTHPVELY